MRQLSLSLLPGPGAQRPTVSRRVSPTNAKLAASITVCHMTRTGVMPRVGRQEQALLRQIGRSSSARHRTARAPRVNTEAKIKTGRMAIVRMGTRYRHSQTVSVPDNDALLDYLKESPRYVETYRLPMGTTLCREPGGAPEHFMMDIQKMEFAGVFVKPRAFVNIQSKRGGVRITTRRTVISGSKEVQELALQDRYEVNVNVLIRALAPNQLECAAAIDLEVDMPFPFSLTPAPVTEAAGNAITKSLVKNLMEVFAESTIKDFNRWLAESRQAVTVASEGM